MVAFKYFHMDRMSGLSESPAFRENWRKDLHGSVYTAAGWGKHILIGGSDWNRRTVPYSKTIAQNAGGQLHLCDREGNTKFIMAFPSMIYSCLPLPCERVFIGCKGAKKTGVILDKRGFIMGTANDDQGQGVYNSLYSPESNEIVTATRTGKLITYNGDNLFPRRQWQLASPDTRLWSLVLDNREQNIYTGDYNGVLHKVNLFSKAAASLDLKNYFCGHPSLEDGLGPSVWGLEQMDDGSLAVGTRWNRLFIISPELEILASHEAPGSITSLKKIAAGQVLAGMRSGDIYTADLINGTFRLLSANPPATQKENAVWGLGKSGEQYLAAIADGTVLSLSLET